MSDKFLPALADLKEAFIAGDRPEAAIQDAAEEHGLSPAALEARARRQWGDNLEDYQKRIAQEAVETAREAIFRRDMAIVMQSWVPGGTDKMSEADRARYYAIPPEDFGRIDEAARRKVQGVDEDGRDPTIGLARERGAIGLMFSCPKCEWRYVRKWSSMGYLRWTKIRDVAKRNVCSKCYANLGEGDVTAFYAAKVGM